MTLKMDNGEVKRGIKRKQAEKAEKPPRVLSALVGEQQKKCQKAIVIEETGTEKDVDEVYGNMGPW